MTIARYHVDNRSITYQPGHASGHPKASPDNPTCPVTLIDGSDPRHQVLALARPGDGVVGWLLRVTPDGMASVELAELDPAIQKGGWYQTPANVRLSLRERIARFIDLLRNSLWT